LSSWHERPSEMPTCNPNADGCAWAACGKSLVSSQTALGTRDSSIRKRAGCAMTRFPTGRAGPWKTLVSIRWCRSYEMSERKRVPRATAASFPQPLCRGRGARRLLLMSFFNCQSSELEVHIDHRLITDQQRCFVPQATRHRYSIGQLLRRPGCRELSFRHGHF